MECSEGLQYRVTGAISSHCVTSLFDRNVGTTHHVDGTPSLTAVTIKVKR